MDLLLIAPCLLYSPAVLPEGHRYNILDNFPVWIDWFGENRSPLQEYLPVGSVQILLTFVAEFGDGHLLSTLVCCLVEIVEM